MRQLVGIIALCCAPSGTMTAQESPSSTSSEMTSIVVLPARFATLEDAAHLLGPGSSVTVAENMKSTWWGLGTGATVGAAAALTLTQAFCANDNGCVGQTIGAALMGSLLGGALETGMDY